MREERAHSDAFTLSRTPVIHSRMPASLFALFPVHTHKTIPPSAYACLLHFTCLSLVTPSWCAPFRLFPNVEFKDARTSSFAGSTSPRRRRDGRRRSADRSHRRARTRRGSDRPTRTTDQPGCPSCQGTVITPLVR